MKQAFTHNSLRRMLLVALTILSFATQANAGSTWYAYYTKITAYPTGKGQVYASLNSDEKSIEWKAEQEMKFTSTGGIFFSFAQPAAGYKFAGFSQATKDTEGSLVFNDSIITTENPGVITTTSSYTDNPTGSSDITSDSATVAAMMPLEPETGFYALFTKVTTDYAAGQKGLGNLTISKVCNDTGDKVTITATPADNKCKFKEWTLNGKTVSTDPTYSFTVSDTATYKAHFTSEYADIIDFGTGKWMYWYMDSTTTTIPANVKTYSFYSDSISLKGVDSKNNTFRPMIGSYGLPSNNAFILYGEGEATFVKTRNEYPVTDENSLNRWSFKGVNIDTLDVQHNYYLMDTKNQVLNLQSKGTVIPANTTYIALPDTVISKAGLTAAPSAIYLSTPTGIENVKAFNIQGLGKIYTISGIEKKTMDRNGLYIVDGKKVFYRRK
jgi:hypothetical protein